MKVCSKCGSEKVLEDFYKHPGGIDGRRGDCKVCVLAARRQRYLEEGDLLRGRVKEYQKNNPEKLAKYEASSARVASVAKSTRRSYLLKTYGLTVEKFDEMFTEQGGRCAVCKSDDPVRSWTVDHDHVTGAVRGILCWHCNVGLGHFRDDASNLIAAADYLLTRSSDEAAAPE